jgi:putative transcriptional regulator
MIQCRLRELIAIRSREQGKRITYREITLETGIFSSTLSPLANNTFTRVDKGVLDRLCAFFNCGPGDLLIHVPDPEQGVAKDLKQ